jgi:hypothetical protein
MPLNWDWRPAGHDVLFNQALKLTPLPRANPPECAQHLTHLADANDASREYDFCGSTICLARGPAR